MMRFLPLLALLGAAPAMDITPAATCTLDQRATEAAFRALPLVSTEDDTEADETGTLFGFDPSAAALWGTRPSIVALTVYANRTTGDVTQSFETRLAGDYNPARGALVAAHAKATCDRETGSAGSRRCELSLRSDGAWARSATLAENGAGLTLACAFSKRG